jgi:hypothetical protein
VVGRVAAVALVVALCATACGGHSQRNAVSAYLAQVNTTENKLAAPLRAVSKANEAFAKQQTSPKARAQLTQSVGTLTTLRRRLAAVTPPPDARHLQSLLLQLIDSEISLTHELIGLSTFVPRFDAVVQPLGTAGAGLQHVLVRSAKGVAAAKAVDEEKAAALRTYATGVGNAIGELHTLHPPDVWRPTYTAQLSALEQLHTTALALAAAIAGGKAAAVPGLLSRFDEAAASGQSLAAQRAQIAAVDAYNSRVQSVSVLAERVERERNRLQRVTT